ncbi:O-methyltransferase [Jannaschia pagri]|uniref:O-methyltransferase n=1 Tax=Jannaschia pagri TaxID=2829797 RepID=A0ABQ4NKA0_9RHOB|nr:MULTISPECIES: class I SAM-dependent methyltransferase [unclassified Jannaschia]GIT90802.1 O-methyltransferase [Jannaschia sp. AI_61]GIT94634.1 O-methyltransferase [Jannaschia sp. AI_62]
MAERADHGALMDETYRYQRLIYDVTRKYYLLGRDHLIEGLDLSPGQTVLEVGCGTGRNLLAMGRRYPQARLFGLDISEQMLTTARAKLGQGAVLARGDACAFAPEVLFGVDGFDRIVLSYSLSMIPDWRGALAEARRHLAPGGQVHIVDFGDQADLPLWFKRGLRHWLARFHVAPRDGLGESVAAVGAASVHRTLYRGYASYAVVARA